MGSGTPFLLDKLWLKDIEYEFIDYSEGGGGGQGGEGSESGGEEKPSSKKGFNGGLMAIIGGCVGGLSLIGLIVFLIIRKRKVGVA